MADDAPPGQSDEARQDDVPVADEPDAPDEPDPSTARTDHPDDDEHAPSWQRLTLNEANVQVLGRMILHYAERDVTVFLDGDAAMRLLTTVQSEGRLPLGDRLDPLEAIADRGWVMIRPLEPLALSWIPISSGTSTSRPVAFEPTA